MIKEIVMYVEFDGNEIRLGGLLQCEEIGHKLFCRFDDLITFTVRKYLIINNDNLVWGVIE